MSLVPLQAAEHRLRFEIARAPERTEVVLGRGSCRGRRSSWTATRQRRS